MRLVVVCMSAGLLVACGGGGGGGGSPPSYRVTATAQTGGVIQPGMATVASGGTATFTVGANSGYAVDTVSGCGGALAGSSFTTASITTDCTVTATFRAIAFHVDVTGNAAGGLIVDNNGLDPLAIDADGRFAFTSGISAGAPYSVRVRRQPATQVCRVENGTGTISATATIVVAVRCVDRIVSTPLLTLRTSLGAAGELAQTLYVRSPPTSLQQYRVRQSDGGLDVIAPPWAPFSSAQTFTFSADGSRVFADDGVGGVAAAAARDTDGALVHEWSQLFGNYVPVLPFLLNAVRPSHDGAMLYRNAVFVLNGMRHDDLWAGAVADTGVLALAGSPFPLGSDGGGPTFDPTGRYFVRDVQSAGVLEVYAAFTSATVAPALLHSSPRTLVGSPMLLADASPGRYVYETRSAQVTGSVPVSPPRLAVHEWQANGSLSALGGPLAGVALTGEIANEVCVNGSTATMRFSVLAPLGSVSGAARYVVQRQDARCVSPFVPGLRDSRALGVAALSVSSGQAALTWLPLDSLPGWTDVGAGGAAHPGRPWLYLGSKHAQRVYGYSVDAATGTAQPLPGSPYEGATAPPATEAAIPVVLMDPTGRFLYMARAPENPSSTYVEAFTIDAASGAATAVATYAP